MWISRSLRIASTTRRWRKRRSTPPCGCVPIWVRSIWNWLATGSPPLDFDRAHDELAVARRALPNDAEVLFMAGRIDRRQNRWDDSLANLLKVSELDPRNTEINYHLRRTYREMRRYAEFEQRFAHESDPDPAQNFGSSWSELSSSSTRANRSQRRPFSPKCRSTLVQLTKYGARDLRPPFTCAITKEQSG